MARRRGSWRAHRVGAEPAFIRPTLTVLDPDDHGSAGVTGAVPGEQSDPVAAQPQHGQQLDNEPQGCATFAEVDAALGDCKDAETRLAPLITERLPACPCRSS